MQRLIGLLSVSVVAVACQCSEGRKLGHSIAPQDLLGTWVLTGQSERDIKALKGTLKSPLSDYKFALFDDGNCRFDSFLPVLATGEPLSVSPFHGANCRWETSAYDHGRQAVLITLGQDGPISAIYNIDELPGTNRLVLWHLLADPDLWKYAEYIKSGGG